MIHSTTSSFSSILPTKSIKTPIFLVFIQFFHHLSFRHHQHNSRSYSSSILTSAFSSFKNNNHCHNNNNIQFRNNNLIKRHFITNNNIDIVQKIDKQQYQRRSSTSSSDMEITTKKEERMLNKREEPLSILLASKIISLVASSDDDDDKEEKIVKEYPKVQCTISIAGGGSTSISSLTSISKSSSILLEGNILYSKQSFKEYISHNKDNMISSFSSIEAAIILSKTSLQRSYDYTSTASSNERIHSIGIGCASSLKSGDNEREGRAHKCYIRLSNIWGYACGYDCILQSSLSRIEQEEQCGSLILYTLLKYILEQEQNYNYDKDVDDDDLKQILTYADETFNNSFVSWNYVQDNKEELSMEDGIEGILSNQNDSILLLPSSSSSDDNNKKKLKVISGTSKYIPKQSIIIPGSFNPIHVGHIALAKAAYDKFITTTTTNDSDYGTLILFEISIINVDKPPLQMNDILKRIDIIESTLSKQNNINNWGVILTSSPLFAQKVNIFQNRISSSSYSKEKDGRNNSSMVLVIGADTFIRILNKKYYDNNIDKMIDSIREMKIKGVAFIIGGRLEQIPGSTSKKFINGKELIDTLPHDLKDMFIFLDENDFRVDVSSTEIRKQQQHDQNSD